MNSKTRLRSIESPGVAGYIWQLDMVATGEGRVGGEIRPAPDTRLPHEPEPLLMPLDALIIGPIVLEFRYAYDEYGEEAFGDVIKSITVYDGWYELVLPAGIYTVTAIAEGFLPSTRRVLSYGGWQLLEQDIELYEFFGGGIAIPPITRPLDMIPDREVDGVAFVWIRDVAYAYGFTEIDWDGVGGIITIHGLGSVVLSEVGGFFDRDTNRAYVPRYFAFNFFPED